MEFINKHGKRLEAVCVVEEAKHGNGCLFVEVLKSENKYNVYHVPLHLIPDDRIKACMSKVKDFDKFIYICLKTDDGVNTLRVCRAQTTKANQDLSDLD